MKKIILIGRVAAGKTTLTQALRGEEIHYFKTQYVNYLDTIIDTPGEYTELRQTSGALALYSYEADVVGLVLSANEPYSIFSPCITSLVNREVELYRSVTAAELTDFARRTFRAARRSTLIYRATR